MNDYCLGGRYIFQGMCVYIWHQPPAAFFVYIKNRILTENIIFTFFKNIYYNTSCL